MFRTLLYFFMFVSGIAHSGQTMRLVSAGGSITEIIYTLDKQDLIVATDSTSLSPSAARNLPKLGYFRQLSVEGVLSFQPTHLIGAQATGPEELAEQLRAAGVSVTILGEQRNLGGLYDMIRDVAVLVDAQDTAQQLINAIDKKVAALKIQAHVLAPSTALFVMSTSERGLTVAGGNTVPQALFDDAGIVNAAANMKDYKVMDNESILRADPDLIFVASHNVYSEQARLALCQHPALKATKAGKNCNITTMESSSALGLSPRYPEALQAIIAKAALIEKQVD
ncbi:MAG: ABC transporter substrate-binding protein [Paraglaciecola sp.]|nr:ABC transporter substrate-binding protein [Paraglaciecola sp.]